MRDAFWNYACQATPIVRILLMVELVLAILLAYSAPALSPGKANYYIAGFSAIVILVTVVGLLYVYLKCRSRRTR